jgi:hypothetical protein
MKKQYKRSAPVVYELNRRVRITHPFHPLHGQQFDLLTYRRSWGNVASVDLQDKHGRVLAIPLAWTDACDPDPFVASGAGPHRQTIGRGGISGYQARRRERRTGRLPWPDTLCETDDDC